ncbi:TonB family protein [Mucilaginibacter robiniae]|uniref:TonB family protein n=1 Tax=Mucilaginibacter robiniae TaxID=2728022 RepID=A0A7L5E0A5_9SPHI|nr:TonB family protein [Mucilaginibacter robiniae]QJD95797.1 TonB family protein [Mucilaginibacter robiniae]
MTWWHYLLLCNLYLILFFGFYALLLRRETFFQLNRAYLVGSALLSFLIPLIQSAWVRQWFITQKVHQTIYSAGPAVVIYQFKPVQSQQITLGEIMTWVYIGGIVILSLRLLWQLLILSRVVKRGTGIAAWSFFKKIKVDEQLPNRDVILAHEEVHARQWHSADVLLIETIMILNWFNPVVYWYRNAIKHIHEFIADETAVKAGASKAEYAMLLLNQTFDAPVHKLLNPFFSHSVLKQRIVMLQKNKSHYSALIKYGFSAPLFALMLALSSATINNSSIMKTVHTEAAQVLAKPAEQLVVQSIPPPPPPAKDSLAEQALPVIEQQNPALNNIETNAGQSATTTELAVPEANTSAGEADPHNELFTAVEVAPEFPGGMESFYTLLSKTIRYPAEARDHNVQGRVIVTFVVEKDGSLSDVKALRGPGSGLDEEAVRAVTASPKWVPGHQNGKSVRVQYTVPVLFTLQDVESPKKVVDTTKHVAKVSYTHLIYNIPATPEKKVDSGSVVGYGRSISQKFMNVTPKYYYVTLNAKTATNNQSSPVFLVDGKVVDNSLQHSLPPSDRILRINVVKHSSLAAVKNQSRDTIFVVTKK